MRQRMARRIQTVCVVVVAVSTTNAASPAEAGGGGAALRWDVLGRNGIGWDDMGHIGMRSGRKRA